MRQFIIRAALIVLCTSFFAGGYAKPHIIKAKGKFDSRFAIFVDKRTFDSVKEDILAYQKVLVEEGLGAFIVIDDWKRPEDIKKIILEQYKKRPIMEGMVFIGDIPVARVWNGQHMTSAFKMDEVKFPKEESSVPTDRFYDDLDLTFEFLCADEKNPLHFYYKLKESSAQKIESELYSARMRVPFGLPGDRDSLLGRYLKKVVAAHKERNIVDRLIVFNGHGYNSDCLTAWGNEQFAMREYFPTAFNNSMGNSFYNFRQYPYMKYKLFDVMQRPGSDIFIFHEHGAYDTQYINGEYPAGFNTTDVTFSQANKNPDSKIGHASAFAISLRNIYRSKRGEAAKEFAKEVIKEFGLLDDFFEQSRLDSLKKEDSLFSKEVNIYLKDLAKLNPTARFTILDACYNGSFHRDDYVAAYHIFGGGSAIVAQGNSVNVLQDKWTIELLGMVNIGARIGFWQREVQFLESHLIGDPTYSFYSHRRAEINRELAINRFNRSEWSEYYQEEDPNLKALAIKQIYSRYISGDSKLLLNIFISSPYYTVRMEALKRLIDISDDNTVRALAIAMDDPYELIRRNAARYSGYSGAPSLIYPLLKLLIYGDDSQRVQYAARSALITFSPEAVLKEANRILTGADILDKESIAKSLEKEFNHERRRFASSVKTIADSSADVQKRVSAVRSFRNYNVHDLSKELIAVMLRADDDLTVRISIAEALGWFVMSESREAIRTALETVYKDPNSPVNLRNEALQSILRLK